MPDLNSVCLINSKIAPPLMSLDENTADFLVQTSAYLHRHYYKIPADRFDYIVVDEAHHAAAQGLRNILEHFSPTHLLGVTATPRERFDQQSLEEISGEYEPQFSLEEGIRQGLVPPVRCYRVQSTVGFSPKLLKSTGANLSKVICKEPYLFPHGSTHCRSLATIFW